LLIKKINDIREQIKEYKKQGMTIALVPTMGALHEGHLSLIKNATQHCDKVIVSVFVNPIQFGPSEDYAKYPRTLEADYKLCIENNVDIVFSPSAEEMYGEGFILSNDNLTYVCPPFNFTDKLCGKSRIGHFDGVCTVVNKLFNIVQPDFAFFGEKDAQQLIIIKKMVKDLNIPVEIIPCPIVREENGLALSSRNKYLSAEAKQEALVLSKILQNIKACFKKGITNTSALKETAFSFLNENTELEYLEIFDADSLEELETANNNSRVFIACKIGGVRLIDNIKLGE